MQFSRRALLKGVVKTSLGAAALPLLAETDVQACFRKRRAANFASQSSSPPTDPNILAGPGPALSRDGYHQYNGFLIKAWCNPIDNGSNAAANNRIVGIFGRRQDEPNHVLDGVNRWYELKYDHARYLILGIYNVQTGIAQSFTAYNQAASWQVIDTNGRTTNIGNGQGQTMRVPVGNYGIELSFYNPQNSDGYNGNHIIYNFRTSY